MLKNVFLILLIANGFQLKAQTRGTVIDSLGTPIPYVNIWVDGENIGTTSEEDGTFTIGISGEKTLVFSAVGFETRRTSVKADEKIILKAKIYQLDEVAIQKIKNTKEIEVGEAKKIRHRHLSGDKPWIYAKLFPFEKQYEETPFLKSIVFFSYCEKRNAKIKIRLFEFNNFIPTADLITEDIIVSVKKGIRKYEIDVSKYKLKIPENGLVVGLEWLIIDENKFEMRELDNDEKKVRFSYAPSLIINYSEDENAFSYRNGVWERAKKFDSKTNKPWNNKILAPAINLTLTN